VETPPVGIGLLVVEVVLLLMMVVLVVMVVVVAPLLLDMLVEEMAIMFLVQIQHQHHIMEHLEWMELGVAVVLPADLAHLTQAPLEVVLVVLVSFFLLIQHKYLKTIKWVLDH
tara:strand:+ start:472 stop:810 length:339 start_codon:yes stop_codon:yes gene_type:complete